MTKKTWKPGAPVSHVVSPLHWAENLYSTIFYLY